MVTAGLIGNSRGSGFGVDKDSASVSFFDRTFDEALKLLIEARTYITMRDGGDPSDRQPLRRLVVSCEIMRLGTRLTQIMAWLMAQKAVHAGEMTAAEASRPQYRLGGHEVCLAQDCWDDVAFSPTLQDLLDRSLNLYLRVARLDVMASTRLASGGDSGPDERARCRSE